MLPTRYATTFSSGYTAYWDARSTDRTPEQAKESALRRARKWVAILGEVVEVKPHPPGPQLAVG